MNTQSSIIIILLFNSVFNYSLQEKPLVKIHQGIVQGTTVATKNGRSISAFQGIPYAESPIGELRFSSPLPSKAWDGIYLANKQPNSCPQLVNNGIIGDENCLYLNVFTPFLNFKSSSINGTLQHSLLPVMVWVHGGAFVKGSTDVYGPTYLLDKDVILVSMHYRLGILGFLTTGDEIAPGNFGLKDQVLALKWVQKNIRLFGGDPNKVTLFGESAGGAAVTYHVLSDASNGLFHQYIIQSGIAASPWAYRKRSDYKPFVKKVAKNVSCSIANSTVLIKCLREASVNKLLKSGIDTNYPVLLWTPTDEIKSEDAFLTESPQNLIAKNKMKDYFFISGTVVDEGLLATLQYYEPSVSFETIKNYLEKSIDNVSKYYMADDLLKFKTLIINYYFNKSIAFIDRSELLTDYARFVSDSGFFYPELLLLEKVAKEAKSSFYLYSFGYRGNMTIFAEDYKNRKGVPHAAELYYLFPRSKNPISKEDKHVIDIMVDLWTSFATNRKPTSIHLEDPNLWLPYTKNSSLLQIGDITNNTNPSVTRENNYFVDRMNFWRGLVPM